MGRPRSNNLNKHLSWLFSSAANYVPEEDMPRGDAALDAASSGSAQASKGQDGVHGLATPPLLPETAPTSDSDLDFLAELSGESFGAPGALAALPMPPPALPRADSAEPIVLSSEPTFEEITETPQALPLREVMQLDLISSDGDFKESQRCGDEAEESEPELPAETFRMAGSQATNGPLEIEIGPLLAEKIALLEKKVGILSGALRAANVHADTRDVDARLKGLEMRIADFADDEPEVQASSPLGTTAHNDYIFDSDDVEITGVTESRHREPEPILSHTQTQPAVASMQHEPWYKEVLQTLHTRFGLRAFRPNQAEAVGETLRGNDVVVLMPTGGGKSLCYQLPALIRSGSTRGTTVVISPLISLMEDQVYHLKNRNIHAEMINSKLAAGERQQAFSLLESDMLELVYLSPEMLSASAAMKSTLKALHARGMLARVVIDEAHCVSAWGHDFRPEYMELTNVKNLFPGTPIMALTATANNQVLLDIVNCLRPNPLVLKQSFNRTNLTYEVKRKTAKVHVEIAQLAQTFAGRSGIVYCWSKKDCESTAKKLVEMGVSAGFYHAGMDTESRSAVQTAWQQGETQVVCATIAFGMGIDKPDVRFVVHLSLPRNMEGYYQETGRAGRDGKMSQVVLFYRFGEYLTMLRMIREDRELKPDVREHHIALLKKVMQYCENDIDCRRKQVLQYFNEQFDPRLCEMKCDNCRSMREKTIANKDVSEPARDVVRALDAVKLDRITEQQCIEILCGRSSRKIRECGYARLEQYGCLSKYGATFVERLVHDLLARDILEDYTKQVMRFSQSYVRLGPHARAVLDGTMRVTMRIPTQGTKRSSADANPAKRARVSTRI